MKYLFDYWSQIKKEFLKGNIFLFFDYDGTLTPIVETPDKAVISRKAKSLLKELLRLPNYRVAIISGRALTDIKKIIGLKDIIYAGNHGLEIEGPKIKFISQVSPRLAEIIGNIYLDLADQLLGIRGAFVEDKGLTISVHYRKVSEKDLPLLQRIFRNITNPYLVRGKIRVNSGKKVFEVKPPVQWDKGKTVMWLLARQELAQRGSQVIPVYLGDDATDEDAFGALKNKGLTIFVGDARESAAEFYLNNTQETLEFMRIIIGLRKKPT